MDSLLHLGLDADGSDSDESSSDGDGAAELAPSPREEAGPSAAVDYEALQRAGLRAATDLRQTETYQRLEAEEAEKKDKAAAAAAAAAQAEAERKEAIEKANAELLDKKKIDAKLGYEKRYDRTKEDFRAKEARKRAHGQQASSGDYVQEEKRRLRHGMTGNYDS
jgi:hypothetical protein